MMHTEDSARNVVLYTGCLDMIEECHIRSEGSARRMG